MHEWVVFKPQMIRINVNIQSVEQLIWCQLSFCFFPRLNQTCQCWQTHSLETCPAQLLSLTDHCITLDIMMTKKHPVSLINCLVDSVCCLCWARFCTVCSLKTERRLSSCRVKLNVTLYIYIFCTYNFLFLLFCTESWWQHIIMITDPIKVK